MNSYAWPRKNVMPFCILNRNEWAGFIGKYVLTLCATTHITRMKQPSQWTCGLVVNASYATFESNEFDFLVYFCFVRTT